MERAKEIKVGDRVEVLKDYFISLTGTIASRGKKATVRQVSDLYIELAFDVPLELEFDGKIEDWGELLTVRRSDASLKISPRKRNNILA